MSAPFRSLQAWAIWRLSRGLLVFVLVADVAAVVLTAAEASRALPTSRSWAVFALLLLLALVFEEGATRIARMQWRLSSDLKRDMTSVWAVAAAVALPGFQAAMLLSVVMLHIWWRQQRPNGRPVYRGVFGAATALLSCGAAGEVVHAVSSAWPSLPWALAGSLAVVAAIAVYTGVNRTLVSIAMIWTGAPMSSLLGSLEDNLAELSTLFLGGLVAVVALYQPWLCVLVLLPMAMLQRGSFVRELETAAVTDAKTGLLNAVGWDHLVQREMGRARRENYAISLLIIDIDHFKRVNDRHGHVVGDQVLRGLGRELTAGFREYDSVARFGGEEFVAVLPEAGEVEAFDIAERVRLRVHAMSLRSLCGVDDDEPLSVSIGIVTAYPEQLHTAELSSLLVSADQALYRAKDSGRNRVCLADPDERPEIRQNA